MRGQSAYRKHQVFVLRYSCLKFRTFFLVYLFVMLIFRGLPITARWYGELPSVKGWHAFLHSPGKLAGVFSSRRSCPDGCVPVNGREFSHHDIIVLVALQKPWQLREGQQPYWLCLDSRISHGTEILISGNDFDRIDLWSWLLSCPGCWRQLPIPSVLYLGQD